METKKETKLIKTDVVIVSDLLLLYFKQYFNIDWEKINNALAEIKRLKRDGLL